MHDVSEKLFDVPLFPLPNVVLFPRAVLPLHIFEERYKAMTADALEGDRLIAMALLRPGWETNYYARPEIEPVVCVGKILTHERLPDGKYNFLLEGQVRATIVQEHGDELYRIARLEPLAETKAMEIDLSEERRRLLAIFSDDSFDRIPLARQFHQMLTSPLPTADVCDLIAFNLIEDVQLRQQLLADADVHRRVQRVIETLDYLRPLYETTARPRMSDPSVN